MSGTARYEYIWVTGRKELNDMGALGYRVVPGTFFSQPDDGAIYLLMEREYPL